MLGVPKFGSSLSSRQSYKSVFLLLKLESLRHVGELETLELL